MASSPVRDLPELPSPGPEWEGLQRHYEQLTMEALTAELARINSLQESLSRSSVSAMLDRAISSLDQPVLRSRRTAVPSRSPDRGQPTTSPSPLSALDRLLTSSRMGPRLAAKVTIASARAQGRRKDGPDG